MRYDQGWLAKEFRETEIAIMRDHDPDFVMQLGLPVTLPVSKEDADELFKRLSHRFHLWTGEPLKR